MKIEITFSGLCILFSLLSVLFFTGCSGSETSAQPTKTAASVSVTESIKQADAIYAKREDLAKLREGINLLKTVQAEDQQNFEVAWKIAQSAYFLGEHTEDKDERKKAFEEGINAARAAIAIHQDKPEGHFWLGANLGGKAKINPMSGLTAINDIRQAMETVIKIDEKFQSGSAYLALGQLELETTGLLGGDKKKALEYLEKGYQINSENSLMRLRLAEAYIANDRKDDARKQIDYILQMKPDPNYLPEHNDSVKETKKLLEKLSQA